MSTLQSIFDSLESLHSLLPRMTETELIQLEHDLSLLTPGFFAKATSQGKWQRARHLAYLDQVIFESIQAAENNALDGLVINLPPQHGKSELVSKYLPAWYLGTYPDRRVILCSYEADFAASWGRKARDLLEVHGKRFGVQVSKKSSAANRWELAGRDGGMSTAGVGGPITGKGAHLLIIDDPIKNDEEARSSNIRDRHWEWWMSTASTRLRPNGLTILIQTRWHRDDLTGRILENASHMGQNWRVVKLPAIASEDDQLGRKEGEALWPEMYSESRLEKFRAGKTSYYWQAMYQQNPQAEGGTEWPADYFDDHIWTETWPERFEMRVMALDPSKGRDSKKGDFTALVFLGSLDGIGYVDAILERWPLTDIVRNSIDWTLGRHPDGLGIESNQFQELLLPEFLRQVNERNLPPIPTREMNNQVKKELRIARLGSFLANKQLRFRRSSSGARRLVQQLRDFPHGDHDDGPDALEMAIRLFGELCEPPPYDSMFGPLGRFAYLPGVESLGLDVPE